MDMVAKSGIHLPEEHCKQLYTSLVAAHDHSLRLHCHVCDWGHCIDLYHVDCFGDIALAKLMHGCIENLYNMPGKVRERSSE